MELESLAGADEGGGGVEEEGEGEGVSGEEDLFVEEDGVLGGAAEGVVADEGVVDYEGGVGSAGDEVGVELEGGGSVG